MSVVAGFILISAKKIGNFRIILIAAIFPVLLVALLRWNYNFAGLVASISYDPYTPIIWLRSYTPTWQEWAVGTGVISYWLLGFSFAARFLPFHAGEEAHH